MGVESIVELSAISPAGKPRGRVASVPPEVRMGEVVNLNRVRKERAKAESRATASAGRVAHGRSKDERIRARTERERAARLLDGSKLED